MLISALFVFGSTGTNANLIAPDDLVIGSLYSCPQMNDYSFKVISCDAKGWCQVFIVNKFSPNGGNVTGQSKSTTEALIKKYSCTVEGAAANAEPKQANDIPAVPGRNTPIAENGAPAGGAGDCTSDPRFTAAAKPGDSIELKSKRAILAHFQQAVDKGDKVGVGITFDNFAVGATRTNIRGVNYYPDAAVGAKIYSVKTKFTLCSAFSTEVTHDITDGFFDCFKDNFGGWACGTATGYKIIKTTYEKRNK